MTTLSIRIAANRGELSATRGSGHGQGISGLGQRIKAAARAALQQIPE
jgi:hypothetical protein